MKTLLKNGTVINVFTGKCEKKNILINDDTIIGVGAYTDSEADIQRFKRMYGWLWDAYMKNKVTFEEYLAEHYLTKYLK